MDTRTEQANLRDFALALIDGDMDEITTFEGRLDGNAVFDPINMIRIMHRVAQGGVENAAPIAAFVVEVLGADPNAKDALGNSPLHYAAQYSSEMPLFNYLVKVCDLGQPNNQGDTPIFSAIRAGNLGACVALASFDIDLNVKSGSGETINQLVLKLFGKEGIAALETIMLAKACKSVTVAQSDDGRKIADIGGHIIDLSDIETQARPQQARRRL